MRGSLAESFQVVRDGSHQIVRDMVRGDIALRRHSIDQLDTGFLWPFVAAAREMRAGLRFEAVCEAEDSWLFGLFKETDQTTTADIRMRIGIAASREPGAPGPETGHLLYSPPVFLVDASSTMARIRCHSGREVRVRMRGRRPRFFSPRGTDTIMPEDSCRVDVLVDLLDTFRVWAAADGGDGGRLWTPPPVPRTRELIGAVVQHLFGLHSELARFQMLAGPESLRSRSEDRDLWRGLRRLRRIHPDLAPIYDWAELESRILVRWDDEGRLVVKGSDQAWLRADIIARLTARHPPCLNITLRPSDVLFKGHRFFEPFLKAVTARSFQISKEIARRLGIDREEVVRLFERLDQLRTVLVRIDDRDHDLVLLRSGVPGSHAWALLGVHFIVEKGFPEVRVSAEFEKLLDAGLDAEVGSHRARYENIPEYFRRWFRILLAWQSGLREG